MLLLLWLFISHALSAEQSRWVLLSVHLDGTSTVMHHNASHRAVTRSVPYIERIDAKADMWVSYRGDHGATRHVPLPRVSHRQHYDAIHHDSLRFEGKVEIVLTREVDVQVPLGVKEIWVHHPRSNRTSSLSLRRKGTHFHTLQMTSAGGKLLDDMSVVVGHVNEQKNIVVLSAGYKNEENFRADFTRLLDFMQYGVLPGQFGTIYTRSGTSLSMV